MKPYQALIWNEWRQMRGNVMALGGVTVLLWLLLLLGSFNNMLAEYAEMVAVALIICLLLLYSVVLGDSFAREFGQKTDCFLLELPITPTKIFFCKYCASLMAFLALSAVNALIMSQMIILRAENMPHPSKYNSLLLGLVILLWIPVHGTVFLASLLGRKPGNGIVTIIIMPLLYLLLFPGTMAVTMFFVKDDDIWIISCFWLTLIPLYGICLGFGWYLWTFRIACGKKVLKPVIVVLILMFIVPWLLYGAAYLYFNLSYNLAVREAEAAGIDPVNTIRHVSSDYFECQVTHSTYYASLESTLCLPRYFQRAAEELRRKIRWISANTNIKTAKPEGAK